MKLFLSILLIFISSNLFCQSLNFKTIKLADKNWSCENLLFSDGLIFVSSQEEWDRLSPTNPCYCYINFDESNKSFGLLYNYKAFKMIASNPSIKKSGFRVASKTDWDKLFQYAIDNSKIEELYNCEGYNFNGFNLKGAGFYEDSWYTPDMNICAYWIDEENVYAFSCDSKTEIMPIWVSNEEFKNRLEKSAFMIRLIKEINNDGENYNKPVNSDTYIRANSKNQSDFTYNEIPPGVQLITNEDDWLKYSPIKACCCYPDFNESNNYLGVLYNYKAYEKIKLFLKNSNSNISVADKTEWENIFSQIKRDVVNISKLQLNFYPGYFDQTWYSPTTKTASYWIDENTAVTFSADTYGEPMIDENIINDNELKRQSLAAFSIRIIKSTTNLCDFDKWHKENINVRGTKNQIKFITNLSDWNLYSPTQPCCCYINFDLNNDSYGFIYNQLAYEFLKNDTDLKEKGYRVALDSDWNSLLECVKNNNDYSSLYNCNSDNFNGLNLIPNGFYDNGFWTQPDQSKCRYWSGDNYLVNTIQFNCSKMNEISKIDLSNRRTAAYMIRFIKL